MIAKELKYLATQGNYEDFLAFILKVQGKEFQFLPEIVQTLLSMSQKISLPFQAIDICGTGGDSSNLKTTNISTISSFVLASMGVKVVKHGGRAVSSSSGSLDFLSALGILEIDPHISLEKFGVCFLDARKYHGSFKYIAPFRQKFGQKTIFNMIGPLLNPANISHQMVGISFPNAMENYANILQSIGRENAAIVQSKSGFDELLSFEENGVVFLENGEIRSEVIQPQDFKMPMSIDDSIIGKSAPENADACLRFFENPVQNGIENTLFHTICLNCGLAASLFSVAMGVQEGIDLARSVLIAKKPLEVLHGMRNFESL